MTNWWMLYTKNDCPWCVRAKELLTIHGQDYKEIDITDNDLLKKQLKDEGFKTVPIIYNEDNYIGGYSELSEYLNALVEAKTIKRIKRFDRKD